MEILPTSPNCCYVCNKDFINFRLLKMNNDIGLKEVEIITAHTSCRNLIKKRQKLLDNLLEVDYNLFAKRN